MFFDSERLAKAIAITALFIEHSHREIGFYVGLLSLIILGVSVMGGKRPFLWALLVALLVGFQGGLGALRIVLNDRAGFVTQSLGRDLALVHGFVGQMAFALTALAAVAFTKPWREKTQLHVEGAGRIRRMSMMMLIFFIVQLLIAVFVRHLGGIMLVVLHAVVAFAILAHAWLLGMDCSGQKIPLLRFPALLVGILATVMVLLGFATWYVGGGSGPLDTYTPSNWRIILATIHQSLGAIALTGSLILAARAKKHLSAAN